MADAFTTRNRGRKPESGQHSNAWAALANEDLISDRMDEALDGVVSFSLTGSKTLTSVNGETDEARMRSINITGGSGGTIIIPAVQKWYNVHNGASGTATISNGSNSVALSAEENTFIFTDGTLIYSANSKSYVDAAILNAALSTSLPAQTGNSGKYLGTDGSIASWTAFTSGTIIGALGYTPTSITGLTGAKTTTEIKTGLGLTIGTDVQAYSANLTTYANITPSANVQSLLGSASFSAFRSTLGVAIGTDVQAYDADLAALAGLTSAADKLPYFTGSGTAAVTTLSSFGRSLIDDADAAAARTTLGISSGYTLLDTQATTSGTSVTFSNIDQTYADLLLELLGVSHDAGDDVSTGANLRIRVSDEGSNWTTVKNLTAAVQIKSSTIYGMVLLPHYRGATGAWTPALSALSSNRSADVSIGAGSGVWRIAAGIAHIEISLDTGAFDAGSIKLYGK